MPVLARQIQTHNVIGTATGVGSLTDQHQESGLRVLPFGGQQFGELGRGADSSKMSLRDLALAILNDPWPLLSLVGS